MSGETVEAWLGRAARLLAEAGVEEPRLEARILLAGAAGWPPASIFARRGERLADETARRAGAMLDRRRRRQPAAQILGRREFWGLEFEVTPNVLDPRPDTETLVSAALGRIGNRAAPLRVLDLGTGTGCLLLAFLNELPNAQGLGVDLSPAAVRLAGANAARLGLSGRARFAIGDWGGGLVEEFDVILSNPPYIPSGEIAGLQPEVARWEPWLALDGGADGLDAYRRLAPHLVRLLHPAGFAAVEVGSTQAAAVGSVFARSGLHLLHCARDLAGRERCLLLARG
ncbi:MAG TPA: peptide chain release factor N(5)-glutamine methyltransferase [Alphaproteobacteria bacterium]